MQRCHTHVPAPRGRSVLPKLLPYFSSFGNVDAATVAHALLPAGTSVARYRRTARRRINNAHGYTTNRDPTRGHMTWSGRFYSHSVVFAHRRQTCSVVDAIKSPKIVRDRFFFTIIIPPRTRWTTTIIIIIIIFYKTILAIRYSSFQVK